MEIRLGNIEIKSVATPELSELSRLQVEWPVIQNILDSCGIKYRVTDRQSVRVTDMTYSTYI
jgi:hypothetical protein